MTGSRLAGFSAASITNTAGKGSPREGREELRGHCALIALQFLIPGTDGKTGAFRLRRDERVGVRSRWFLSDPGSSPARARIQQLRRLSVRQRPLVHARACAAPAVQKPL